MVTWTSEMRAARWIFLKIPQCGSLQSLCIHRDGAEKCVSCIGISVNRNRKCTLKSGRFC